MPRAKTEEEVKRGEAFAELLLLVMNENNWNQMDLAKKVGKTQQAVSDWLSGQVPRDPDTVFGIEWSLGLPGGYLSHVLGYVPTGESHVPTAISADEYLTEEWKRLMLGMYRHARGLLEQIETARATEAKSGGGRTPGRRAKIAG